MPGSLYAKKLELEVLMKVILFTFLIFFINSCSSTKTSLRYDLFTEKEITNELFLKGTAWPSHLLTTFNIGVSFNQDSVHVTIYGGQHHIKGGLTLIEEKNKISNISLYDFSHKNIIETELIEVRTNSTLTYKDEGDIFIRFRVPIFRQEYIEKLEISSEKDEFYKKFKNWRVKLDI
jgi:hypothetical protein